MKIKNQFNKSFLILFIVLLSVRVCYSQNYPNLSCHKNSTAATCQLQTDSNTRYQAVISNENQPLEIEETETDEDELEIISVLINDFHCIKLVSQQELFVELSNKKSKQKVAYLLTPKNPINIINCVFLI